MKRSPKTEQISIRVDTEIAEWFRSHAQGKGYQTLINDVLRTYIKHQS
ncbi:MAG: BrnA antitoxin family protein [Snowella sp.]